MTPYYIIVLLFTLSAAFAYINQRWLKLPFVIGLFLLSSIMSLVIILLSGIYINPYLEIKEIVDDVNISEFILEYVLGALLFAGALHTNWSEMRKYFKTISILAIFGVILSALLIAVLVYYAAHAINLSISFEYCLIFGALISPTDPIAVLGILKQAGVPKKTESIIVGESLFNDGIGVVLFISLYQIVAKPNTPFELGHFFTLFLQEAGGGLAFGLILGYLLHYLLKSIDHYETEVLLTIAFVMLGYVESALLHISGPLAMVVMGLMVGNYKTEKSMSDVTLEYMNKFWQLIDVILNALLFIVMAFVLMILDFNIRYFILGGLAIAVILGARYSIINLLRRLLPKSVNLNKKESVLLVWGGLRGGLSLALALSLPSSETKDTLLVVTYVCVVFSILIQGLTVGKLASRLKNKMVNE